MSLKVGVHVHKNFGRLWYSRDLMQLAMPFHKLYVVNAVKHVENNLTCELGVEWLDSVSFMYKHVI